MSTISNDAATSLSTDELLLEALRGMQPQTIESLCTSLPDMSRAQAFLAIDRLSRSGAISLKRTADRDYQVSLNTAVA